MKSLGVQECILWKNMSNKNVSVMYVYCCTSHDVLPGFWGWCNVPPSPQPPTPRMRFREPPTTSNREHPPWSRGPCQGFPRHLPTLHMHSPKGFPSPVLGHLEARTKTTAPNHPFPCLEWLPSEIYVFVEPANSMHLQPPASSPLVAHGSHLMRPHMLGCSRIAVECQLIPCRR